MDDAVRTGFTRYAALVSIALALAASLQACVQAAPAAPLDRVQANDNRQPAGTLKHDTLAIRLVVRMAEWRPETDTATMVSVAAFAEEDKPPQIPAPLIRVREGTIINASVRNALTDSTIKVIGLSKRASASRDTITLKPGETKTVQFAAGTPGTYLYRAFLGSYNDKDNERDQVGGAFVVDPRAGSPPDRILVINIWGHVLDSTHYSNALAINGRSWPNTERFDAVVGDTVRWRVVNASGRPHPMHLHGMFFRVDSKSDGFADTAYAPGARRLVVTEEMLPSQTMSIAWTPVREGRWLFHCHIAFHVIATDAKLKNVEHGSHDEASVNPLEHMAGLIIGINARLPRGAKAPPRGDARKMDLYVQQGAKRGRATRSLGFVLQQGAAPPAPDSVVIPGSPLVLTRDEPTDVTVHNNLKEPVSIHWHGLELESYSDGVTGWSGSAERPAPHVAPGSTFVAHLSMPRAGTFIYHTHVRDLDQLVSGLYGPIVVMEPGKSFDPRTDHVHMVGWDASGADDLHLLVNGDSVTSAPITIVLGETHRFRFINLGAADQADFCLKLNGAFATWRPVAKDGADLPATQRAMQKAELTIDVGETYDFEFTPTRRGVYVLDTPTGPKKQRWSRQIIVK